MTKVIPSRDIFTSNQFKRSITLPRLTWLQSTRFLVLLVLFIAPFQIYIPGHFPYWLFAYLFCLDNIHPRIVASRLDILSLKIIPSITVIFTLLRVEI
jgi:hypothetical protein